MDIVQIRCKSKKIEEIRFAKETPVVFRDLAKQPHMNNQSGVIEAFDDEAGRFLPGEWVRTSPLVSFTENCIFETKNTVYLLVGKGSRKTIPLDTAMSFY